MRIQHINKRSCVENIYIEESGTLPSLKCRKCNRELGFIFIGKNKWSVFTHYKFNKYKAQIERWTYEHTADRDCLGDLSKSAKEKDICSYKQPNEEYIHSVEDSSDWWDEWEADGKFGSCDKNCKEFKSDNPRKTDSVEIETTITNID